MGWHIRNDREREKERASEGEKQMESVVYRLWMNQGAEWGLIAGPSPLQTGQTARPGWLGLSGHRLITGAPYTKGPAALCGIDPFSDHISPTGSETALSHCN